MKIFLSYRRADSQYVSDRLYQALVVVFGQDAVFKDVESIAVGAEFRKVIAEAIKKCDAFLLIIGDRWLDAKDDVGRRRLDASDDMVRAEIEAALESGLTIIPLLTEQARVPKVSDLPQTIAPIAYRNAALIRPDPEFDLDVVRLVQSLRKIGNLRTGEGARPNDKTYATAHSRLRYFCYISHAKVDQLIAQLSDVDSAAMSATANDEAFVLVNYLQGLGYGQRWRPNVGNMRDIIQQLKLVLWHILNRERVGDLNAICMNEAQVPVDAFCYRYSGRFRVVSKANAISEEPELDTTSGAPARDSMVEAARGENAFVEQASMVNSPIQSNMAELESTCGNYKLNLACSLRYFSDMGNSARYKRGALWVEPHSGNHFFFTGRVDAWFEGLIFLNGVDDRNIYGTPLFLVTGTDPNLRI